MSKEMQLYIEELEVDNDQLKAQVAKLKSDLETTTNALNEMEGNHRAAVYTVGCWKEREFIASKRKAELEQELLVVKKHLQDELEQRDLYHEWADKLAYEIARYFQIDIGEHSNINNPWLEAFELIPDSVATQQYLEQQIKVINAALDFERFEFDERPKDYGIRVESLEAILRNLQTQLRKGDGDDN